MPQPPSRETEHEIEISAPAEAVYELIADVRNWPRVFPPTIYVDRLEHDERQERIRIWATAGGEPKNWTSRRTLDRAGLRVDFRQEISTPPVAAMGGAWVIEALGGSGSRVRLLHDYRAIDDDPAGLAWIDEAVDRNSRSELAALKTNVELATAAAERTFSFEDSVSVEGAAEDVYDFLNEANLWPDRLPHVSTVRLTEDTPGLQTLEMDTRAKDGSTHTTVSHRVCLPHSRIAYKQITLPKLLALHTGYWEVRPARAGQDDGPLTVVSQHTVVLETANIAAVLGQDATVEDARAYVHGALSTNSRATLGHAKTYAEQRHLLHGAER
ncbi:aromatase/cyclase [Streptomyces marincola]|uniref:aromatase/cyclase n=1 Tax=Streptomyces marincola TaxID=2878388 RepID=UPI001CF12EE9|nr:aromatase/cyclase [Streptomyces marincola]UCM87083.1 aromatase/cyclase [Streptomyces marincola]